jgi:hypothetical protein
MTTVNEQMLVDLPTVVLAAVRATMILRARRIHEFHRR